MGHQTGYGSFPESVNKKSTEQEIARIASKHGDGWSGPMHWHPEVPVLPNYDAALEWIRVHDKGWYDDHAVRYYDFSNTAVSKKYLELKEKRTETDEKLKAYEKEHSVKNLKASFIGCPNCGSKLAKSHLHSEYCPLCLADLRSKTVLETIANYRTRMEKLSRQMQEDKEKNTKAGEVRWLVKYSYHS